MYVARAAQGTVHFNKGAFQSYNKMTSGCRPLQKPLHFKEKAFLLKSQNFLNEKEENMPTKGEKKKITTSWLSLFWFAQKIL